MLKLASVKYTYIVTLYLPHTYTVVCPCVQYSCVCVVVLVCLCDSLHVFWSTLQIIIHFKYCTVFHTFTYSVFIFNMYQCHQHWFCFTVLYHRSFKNHLQHSTFRNFLWCTWLFYTISFQSNAGVVFLIVFIIFLMSGVALYFVSL